MGVYTFVITATICFSSLLLVIVNNQLSPYEESSYDYILTNFDDNNIKELQNNMHIKDVYASRTVSTSIRKDEEVREIDLNCVDEWDTTGITYYSENRQIEGELIYTNTDKKVNNNSDKNGIVLDVLLAKSLDAKIGDKVYISIGEKELEYEVSMIIEPHVGMTYGQAVCLYDEYFQDEGISDLSYSILFVDTVEGNEADNNEMEDYFYNDYIGPGMDGLTKEEIKEINRNTIIKKEWEVSDVESELEHTPPITLGIFVLGIVVIFLFVLRECRSQKESMNKKVAILSALGQKSSIVINLIVISQMMIILPSILASGVLTKIIYDGLISNYYLTSRLLIIELGIVVLVTFIMCLIVGIIMHREYKKKTVTELLKYE